MQSYRAEDNNVGPLDQDWSSSVARPRTRVLLYLSKPAAELLRIHFCFVLSMDKEEEMCPAVSSDDDDDDEEEDIDDDDDDDDDIGSTVCYSRLSVSLSPLPGF